MGKELSPELLNKYLKNQCTAAEEEYVHQWYRSFEDKEDPLSGLSARQKEELGKLILKRIKTGIAAEVKKGRPEGRTVSYKGWLYALTGAAAAAAVIALFALPFLKNGKQYQQVAAAVPEEITIINTTGGIHKQVLPDSSIVWLSPATELSFPQRFSGGKRQVKMSGEAFFEVAKDSRHPFIIYSGGVITKVLGTSFRIKAYKDVPTEVAVVTGKVSVEIPHKDNSAVELLPDQQVTYIADEQVLRKSAPEDASLLHMWQRTNLSFDNVPVKEVVRVLNKKFDIHIVVGDERINRYLLKADFTSQNLPDILEMLEASLNVTYKIRDDKIIIKEISQQPAY